MKQETNKDSSNLSSPTGGQGAIILAGGLGTRLREAVPDLPKCMAPVAGKPFLSYVIDHLRMQGVERFIFSLGYKWELIEEFLQKEYSTLNYTSVIEEEPLGTGGAIKLAIEKFASGNVVIANGDTLFKINLDETLATHQANNAECTLALKPMQNFDRYGVVETDNNGRIISFQEKKYYQNGLINGGIYLLNKEKFIAHSFAEKFSFEKDYLEKFCAEGNFYGSVQDKYFIDIGIPEDYQRAQHELKRPELDLKQIDKSWTLFLDRDGVINEERVGEYVLHWGEFIFSKGVLEVFKKLSDCFGRVIIVSNQRGVGKGLMTEEDLQSHARIGLAVKTFVVFFCAVINFVDFPVKDFYFSLHFQMNALQAFQEFPDIDPSKSIMVGNKPSDMKFGRAAGLFTVFVRTTNPDQPFPHPDIDRIFPSLFDFASAL